VGHRYGKIEFAYGEQPFLKELIKIPAGSILFPQRAKDETQFMRPQGWNVHAFDQSIQGKKTQTLANKHDVAINYEVGEFQSISY
jgi:hypothetical protein